MDTLAQRSRQPHQQTAPQTHQRVYATEVGGALDLARCAEGTPALPLRPTVGFVAGRVPA